MRTSHWDIEQLHVKMPKVNIFPFFFYRHLFEIQQNEKALMGTSKMVLVIDYEQLKMIPMGMYFWTNLAIFFF